MHPVGQNLDRIMMPLAVERADRVFAVSHSTASQLTALWPGIAAKVQTITPGVTRLPDPLGIEALRLPIERKRFFISVGTLEPRKNLERLLNAHAHGVDSHPDWPSLVVAGGKGWGIEPIEHLVARLGVGHKVFVLGRVTDGELATLYANALALTMPSLYEGFGSPLIEAMSFGTPALASNVSSMPEVLGEAGLLVDPLSIDSIFEGMKKLANDDELRNRLASRALSQASKFSWDIAAEQTLHALLAVAHSGR
jgi:glycosyltransferase involved in cell wall biosynthesis